MHMPMNELTLSNDKRCEARRIRLVDRDDPHFRQISTSRVDRRDGAQESAKVVLDSKDSSKNCIALADCDELLSTGLCFYDEGDAASYSPSWFVILKPMDIERWKCAAALLKETLSSGILADYHGLLHSHEPDWPPLYERRADLGIAVWILFICAGCMYGGLHALAWNSDFRTAHEKIMWRFAVGLIVGFGPAAAVAYLFKNLITRKSDKLELDKRQSPENNSITNVFSSVKRLAVLCGHLLYRIITPFQSTFFLVLSFVAALGFLAVAAVCLGYGIARIFLVVECFVGLFYSVPGVFEEPSWSAYFPHIT